jgi:predicted metal-dependent HD superfamily phosphohydrolase
MSLEVKFKIILENTVGREKVESNQKIVDKWWKTIQDAYTEPQRHYHTIEHINSMWTLLDRVPEEDVNDRNVVGFAIFFHE